MENNLYHYGIKGQKWGIRRYQNYDGTYTQRGLARYKNKAEEFNIAESKRRAAKKNLKINKNESAKREYQKTKELAKKKQKEANKAYDRLKQDKLTDQGKKLYGKGKTITGNSLRSSRVQGFIVLGSAATRQVIYEKVGDRKLADMASGTLALGGTIVNSVVAGKSAYQNKRLRAYYAH